MEQGQTDAALFEKTKLGDKKAFEALFDRYYSYLCLYATQYVKNNNEAGEIAQDVFVRFWEKRDELQINTSVKNYLFRSVKNQCLNFIQHNKIKNQYTQKILCEKKKYESRETDYFEPGLIKKIEEAIQSLPEKRQEIFRLSREQGLKYREIAKKLDISIKTVETQMGLAIKTLRNKLKDYTS